MKYFLYDPNDLSNYKTRITTSKLAKMCRKVVAKNKKYLTAGNKPSGSSYTLTIGTEEIPVHDDYVNINSITIDEGVLITVGNSFFRTKQTTLGVYNLDTGLSFTLGNNYYVYICDPSNGDENSNQDEKYVISLNSTYPEGWNETNSRKIGGFHWGEVRKVDPDWHPINAKGASCTFETNLTDWYTNVYQGIVPNSVWTLLHRPKCSPEGMVYLDGNLWGDIYLSSDDGNFGLQSVYNKAPITGTEGMCWFGHNERAMRSGKRKATYAEYIRAAIGSPPGANNNTNAWTFAGSGSGSTAKAANSGRKGTGLVVLACSSYNVRDLVGNVYTGVRNIFDVETSLAEKWLNFQATWKLGGVLDGECGDLYSSANTSMRAFMMGGHWKHSTNAGRRSTVTSVTVQNVLTSEGTWCVCDSINNY